MEDVGSDGRRLALVLLPVAGIALLTLLLTVTAARLAVHELVALRERARRRRVAGALKSTRHVCVPLGAAPPAVL